MLWVKKHALLFVLIILVYIAFFIFHQPFATSVHVLGAKTDLTLFTQPEAERTPIINAINSAQKEIDVEMYLLTDKAIIDSLLQAKDRGINVKVLLEQHPFNSGNINQQAMQTLQDRGIAVEWTNPVFAFTHEKAVIIDGNEILIMNQNLTAASFGKNREFAIVDDNFPDAQEAKKLFLADWQRTPFTPNDPHLLISPDTARGGIIALLQKAEQTIDIEMEVIDDQQIIQLLTEKAKTKQVRIIIPPIDKIPANLPSVRTLHTAGVLIRSIASPYIHAKLLVIDQAQAYVGSVNFTTQSLDENRELGIVIAQDDIIQNLATDFAHDWDAGVDIQ